MQYILREVATLLLLLSLSRSHSNIEAKYKHINCQSHGCADRDHDQRLDILIVLALCVLMGLIWWGDQKRALGPRSAILETLRPPAPQTMHRGKGFSRVAVVQLYAGGQLHLSWLLPIGGCSGVTGIQMCRYDDCACSGLRLIA